MKHTPEGLAAMSDFERNKCLAELLGYSNIRLFNALAPSLIAVTDVNCSSLDDVESCVDYCNNPSDVMPLVFEHGISLVCQHDKWEAFLYDDASYPYVVCHANPLRAATCCLILVLQEKQ